MIMVKEAYGFLKSPIERQFQGLKIFLIVQNPHQMVGLLMLLFGMAQLVDDVQYYNFALDTLTSFITAMASNPVLKAIGGGIDLLATF